MGINLTAMPGDEKNFAIEFTIKYRFAGKNQDASNSILKKQQLPKT